MNCLKYVLQNRVDDKVIWYNGDHVYSQGLDYKGIFKKESPLAKVKYLKLEICHDVETLSRIFELTEKEVEILKEYYVERGV